MMDIATYKDDLGQQVITALPVVVSSDLTLCACGCGEQVNPTYDAVRVLRDQWHLGWTQIERVMGIDRKYAAILIRKPPKYVKGHVGRVTQWVTVKCVACGHEFRTSSDTGREYCRRSACHEGGLGGAGYDQWLERYDRQVEESNVVARAALENEPWKAEARRIATERLAQREREREANLIEFRAMRRDGLELPWVAWEAMLPKVATPELTEELTELIERQRKDANTIQIAYAPSLDMPVGDDGRRVTTMGDLHAQTDAMSDPQAYCEAQLLDSLVGDLSIAQIHAMSDDQLARLREKLLANGFGPKGIRESERQRLMEPIRHRGEAPSPLRERKSSSRRSPKQQRELMAGKRTSRKQPKRWSRDTAKPVYDWKAAA